MNDNLEREPQTSAAPEAGGTVAGRPSDETEPPAPARTVAYVPPDLRDTVPAPGATEVPADWPEVPGYEIQGVLGRGAMGVVYLARQCGLNRPVALKMILAGAHAGAEERARFQSEAEAAARLQHPDIVQIHEVGEHDGRPFLSLEYVGGGGLDRKIAGTPQPPRRAAELVERLARAMHHAHEHGVIHRDLKPANVLLTPEGGPKISDFGLAKRLEDDSGHTQSGTIIGTPSYMAPEQAAGRAKEVGPAADVYALGAVLYELLAGRAPFRGASFLETVEQVRTQEPVPPTQFQPQVPRDLETVCLKCLQKEPRQRYASALDLADDLGRFLAGEPVRARPVSAAGRLWRWCRRNPRTAALSAAVVLLLAAIALTSSALAWRLKKEKDATEQARELADRNARAAQENAAAADAQRRVAERNAQLAKDQHAEAVREMATLVEKLDGRLRQQAAARPDPEVRALRDDLLGTAMKTLGVMGRQIHDSGVSSFTMVLACQQLGDLFRQHGQGEEAMREYREGCDRVEQVVREQPGLDQARGNLALMLARMGDISLDWAGDPRAARDSYRRALDVQRALAAHPGNGFYKPFDHKRLQSGYLVKLGTADLRLGDPAAARAELLEARALRREWSAGEPQNVSAKSFLAEAHYVLGDAQWRLGEARAADDSFAEALRLCAELCATFPKAGDFKLDLATVDGAYGDVQLRRGQAAEARKRYEKGGEVVEALAAADPENVPYQEFQALTYDRLGTALRRLGDAQADSFVQHALRLHARLAETDPKNVAYRAGLAVALARGGRAAEAVRKADELRGQAPQNVVVLLQVARVHALCAAGAAEDAEKKRETGRALEALTAAAGQGYRDAAAVETDPDLEALRGQEAFRDWVRECKQRAADKP